MNIYPQFSPNDSEINFAIGLPQTSLLPQDLISSSAKNIFTNPDDIDILQYGYNSGYKNFRTALSNFLALTTNRLPPDPDNLFITNGVSHTLSLLCQIYTNNGDTIFVDEITYFMAINIFKEFKLNIIPIQMDSQGISPDDLLLKINSGLHPKLIYIIPYNQNPTGISLSTQRLKDLISLSHQHNFLIISDEVYQLLHFEQNYPYTNIQTLNIHNTVISLGSFSKIFSPGLRLGWLEASPNIIHKLSTCATIQSSGGLNPIISKLLEPILTSGSLSTHLHTYRQILLERKQTLTNYIQSKIPTIQINEPQGGYFLWLQFPPHDDFITTPAFINYAQSTYHLLYQPGYKFSVDNKHKNSIRISFAYYNSDKLKEGIDRLQQAIITFKSQIEICPL